MNSHKTKDPCSVKVRDMPKLGLKRNFLGEERKKEEGKENSESFREWGEGRRSLVTGMEEKFVNQVSDSILHTAEVEADVERFLDLYPKVLEINCLEKLPFWGEFAQYCYSPQFVHPKITIPIKNPLPPLSRQWKSVLPKKILRGGSHIYVS